jgi:hypothetical protein
MHRDFTFIFAENEILVVQVKGSSTSYPREESLAQAIQINFNNGQATSLRESRDLRINNSLSYSRILCYDST